MSDFFYATLCVRFLHIVYNISKLILIFIVFLCMNIKFIHSTLDEQLVSFLFGAILNSATVNILDMSFGMHRDISIRIYFFLVGGGVEF